MLLRITSRFFVILFFCVLISNQVYSQTTGWDSLAIILSRIIPPTFPNNTFNITTYGAVGDGVTDCTAAINNAIIACNGAGGGKVVVPSGTFVTGAIYLKSNVNLYVSTGATLLFTTDKSKFLPVVYTRFEGTECMNYSPLIYAYGETNIAVTGSGTLDGQASGTNWWDMVAQAAADKTTLINYGNAGTPVSQRIFGTGHYLRPSFIEPYNCTNVLIDSVTILRSPMWEVHPTLSRNVTVSNIKINSNGSNNDGCDPECCTDVSIKNCNFNTGDDCIAIKAGKNADGRRVNVPCQNIVIQKCTMAGGHGGVTIGSEMTGGVRNVYVDSCTLNGVYSLLRIKTNTARGGIVENIYIRNTTINTDSQGTINIVMNYGSETGTYIPIVRNIYIQNITSSQTPIAIHIVDLQNSPVTNVQLTDCTFTSATTPFSVGYAINVILKNVWINGILYNTNIGLPVELTSFSAKVLDNKVELTWETATELNNYGFDIERSDISLNDKLINWEKIGFVPGNGNSTTQKKYSFQDKALSGTKYKYRLKQIDYSGQFKYTDEVEINLAPTSYILNQNYPNPFNPSTTISYRLSAVSQTILKVYDMLGKEVATLVNEVQQAGEYKVNFSVSNLPSGIYFYQIKAGNFIDTKKIILLR